MEDESKTTIYTDSLYPENGITWWWNNPPQLAIYY
jgi:hypothetical protein